MLYGTILSILAMIHVEKEKVLFAMHALFIKGDPQLFAL
jgi:hypothetical protein